MFEIAGLYSRSVADRDDRMQEISAQLWRSFGGYYEARWLEDNFAVSAGRKAETMLQEITCFGRE